MKRFYDFLVEVANKEQRDLEEALFHMAYGRVGGAVLRSMAGYLYEQGLRVNYLKDPTVNNSIEKTLTDLSSRPMKMFFAEYLPKFKKARHIDFVDWFDNDIDEYLRSAGLKIKPKGWKDKEHNRDPMLKTDISNVFVDLAKSFAKKLDTKNLPPAPKQILYTLPVPKELGAYNDYSDEDQKTINKYHDLLAQTIKTFVPSDVDVIVTGKSIRGSMQPGSSIEIHVGRKSEGKNTDGGTFYVKCPSPNCQKLLTILGDQYKGQLMKCPFCKENFTVPSKIKRFKRAAIPVVSPPEQAPPTPVPAPATTPPEPAFKTPF